MSPRDDLSHLVDRLLVPLLDSTSRNTFLIFLRDMVFGNRTMTGPGLRALYVAFNVTEGNIPHDAIDRLFQVPTQRFEEITDIIRVKMRPNPFIDVEVVSDMSSAIRTFQEWVVHLLVPLVMWLLLVAGAHGANGYDAYTQAGLQRTDRL
jgi:hypothetical protein